MGELQAFERVLITPSTETVELEVAGLSGTVMASSIDAVTAVVYYAVTIHSIGRTVMVSAGDLQSLGEFEDPADVYDGTCLRISRDGSVIDGSV